MEELFVHLSLSILGALNVLAFHIIGRLNKKIEKLEKEME